MKTAARPAATARSLPAMNPPTARRSWLDWIEWVGNKLPEPVLLFAILAVVCVFASGIGAMAGWSVQPVVPRLAEAVEPGAKPAINLVAQGDPIRVRSLMTGEGVYWMLSSMVRNFITFPPLGLVVVSMLGIGLAEKVGFFSAVMRFLASITPAKLLTPMIVFLGANASIASDAGYIILPPLAAALYAAVGRHPLAGMAAAFAGVAGGFGAGVFVTAADTVLAGFATTAARILDDSVTVNPAVNWYFKAASAPIVALAGWYVTDRIVEPRLRRGGADWRDIATAEVASVKAGDFTLTPLEKRGLSAAAVTMACVVGIFAALIVVKGWPLSGVGQPTLADGRVIVHHAVQVAPGGTETAVAAHDVLAREPLLVTESQTRGRLVEAPGDRWSQVIVPMMFFVFLLPGLAYGVVAGSIKSQADVVEGFYSAIKGIAPVLAMNFFAAQFLAYFGYTNLDRMVAYTGGQLLVSADLPAPLLLVLFVLLVILADFAMSSMTAKFGLLSPIIIPMFMMVGVSPALAMGGYRIGDSVVNVITPLNTYLPILLVVLRKYNTKAGLGTLIALMTPYSLVFGIVWTLFLLGWYMSGADLGPGGGLHYLPPSGG